MLPAWLFLRFRSSIQHPTIKTSINSAPRIEPTTIPAIAPPDRPLLPCTAVGELVEEEDELVEVVPLGKRVPTGFVIGSLTPVHRVSVLEYRQQESVELGEEAAQ